MSSTESTSQYGSYVKPVGDFEIGIQELVGNVRAIHLGEVGPAMRDIDAGWAATGIDPVDDATDGAGAPQNVGRVIIAVDEDATTVGLCSEQQVDGSLPDAGKSWPTSAAPESARFTQLRKRQGKASAVCRWIVASWPARSPSHC